MTTISMSEPQIDLVAVVKRAQGDRVVLEQDGKPVAIVTGIQSYDEEDLATASSPEFWQMIEDRRTKGRSSPLAEVRARLEKLAD